MPAEPIMHPTSLNPYRALMLLLLMIGGSVIFGLVVGWQWYFDNNARRQAIIELAKQKETEAKKRQALVDAAEIREASPSAAPGDNLPRASLRDMGLESHADADTATVPKEPVTISLPLNGDSADVQQADDLLQNYWKAKKWEQRVPLVYQSDRTRTLMEQFYEVQKGTDPVSGALLNRGHYRLDGTEILLFTYSCNRPGDTLELAMRRDTDGRFVLDWTSFVGFSQMAWTQFKKERPTAPTLFRVFALTSDYYNYEFTDRQKFLSVNLLSPDGQTSVHGYCERDSAMGTALSHALSSTSSMRGLVLRLAFSENAESDHCVWIRQYVSDRWLILP